MFAPFSVQNPGTPPPNIRPPSGIGRNATEQMERIRRQRLFHDLEDNFRLSRAPHLATEQERARFADPSKAHDEIYHKGFSLVASREGRVFDLAGESEKIRGRSSKWA